MTLQPCPKHITRRYRDNCEPRLGDNILYIEKGIGWHVGVIVGHRLDFKIRYINVKVTSSNTGFYPVGYDYEYNVNYLIGKALLICVVNYNAIWNDVNNNNAIKG